MSTPGAAVVGLLGRADDDTGRIDLVDDARRGARRSRRRNRAPRAFHAGADERRLGLEQRHRLTLHVRAHQRAVGVVVLEERDERRGDRHELLRADVHELDVVAAGHEEVAGATAGDQLLAQLVLGIDFGIGLGDRVLALFHRREIDDLVGHLALVDLAVRALDEAVLVDAAKVASELIRPMFGPSGVSIGQIRP